jgi:hypothetical protein
MLGFDGTVTTDYGGMLDGNWLAGITTGLEICGGRTGI